MALFVFLGYLAAGLILSLALVRIGAEGRKFFLFNGALALVLGGLGLGLRLAAPHGWGSALRVHPSATTTVAGIAALALLAVYLLAAALGHDRRAVLRLAAVLAVAYLLADAFGLYSRAAPAIPAAGLLHLANTATSAWLCGSILLAMILGHYYLVIPNLSIAPLRSLFRFSLFGLGARVVVLAVVGLLWSQVAGPGALSAASFLRQGVFVLMRLLFGLAIPLSLAWFAWKTIELKSTQSATGILYVVVFLTLVGEALSVVLSLETSLPL